MWLWADRAYLAAQAVGLLQLTNDPAALRDRVAEAIAHGRHLLARSIGG